MNKISYKPVARKRPSAFVSPLDRFFDDFFGREVGTIFRDDAVKSQPMVNVMEGDNAFTIELAAPGLNKQDFNVEVKDDFLVISAEHKTENESDKKNYKRREFSFASFKRTFQLPETVDTNAINATYDKGVLSVVLGKKEEEKAPAPKKIDVA